MRQGVCREEMGQADPLRHFSGKASCILPMCTERVHSFSIGFLKGPSLLESSSHGWNKIE